MRRRDFEALQRLASASRLNFVLEFDEGDVVTAGDQTDFLESRESGLEINGE